MNIDPHAVAEYETLRSEALSTRARRARGWAVFMRHGMLAWSELLTERPPLPAPMAPETDPSPAAHPALVQVLAGMVLILSPEVVKHV